MKYVATHTDATTRLLRARGWVPDRSLPFKVCGCWPAKLCKQHAAIRAVENYHPERIP